MASPESFLSKFALGVLPEYEPKKDPLLYNELSRLRGAIRSIAAALDSYTIAGAVPVGYVTFGNGIGLAVSSSFTFINGSQTLNAPNAKFTSFGCGSNTLGFYTVSAAPIVQPTTGGPAASFIISGAINITTDSTFDGYTVGRVVKSLRNLGLLA